MHLAFCGLIHSFLKGERLDALSLTASGTDDMELTQSAFNLLLDMTALRDEVAEESQVRDHAAQTQQTQEEVVINEPQFGQQKSASSAPAKKIYYYDGNQRMSLSRDELLTSIALNHQAQHLVWVPHQAEWRSWKRIPNLVKAVHQHLLRTRHQEKGVELGKIKKSKGGATTEVETVSERAHESDLASSSLKDEDHLYTAVREDQSQPSLTSPYLSIPETAFTRFTLNLDNPQQLRPYIGWDGTLQSGGLFIKTPRVLHVGDYVQLTFLVNERVVFALEAPVEWLRLPQGVHDHFGGGVGISWPEHLTSAQMQTITHATRHIEYEFFAA